jgi:hypothetical protein
MKTQSFEMENALLGMETHSLDFISRAKRLCQMFDISRFRKGEPLPGVGLNDCGPTIQHFD